MYDDNNLIRLEHDRDTLTANRDKIISEAAPGWELVAGAIQKAINEVEDKIYVAVHGYPF